MAYLLVDPKVLRQKGVTHFNTVPDGRGIIFDSDAKTMGNLGMVQVFWTAKALKDFIAAEEEKAKVEEQQPEEQPNEEDDAQSNVPEEQPKGVAEDPKKESINDENIETV